MTEHGMILVPQYEMDRLYALEKENLYLKKRINVVLSMAEAWRRSSENQQAINKANATEFFEAMSEIQAFKDRQKEGGVS